jgi:hypothetical protein
MVQRTLTALFSLAVLILPVSHLYADADDMTGVYSGLECHYEEARWMPPVQDDPATDMDESMSARLVETYAGMDDVVRHSRLGIGNIAPRMAALKEDGDGDHSLTVSCPLPSLDYGTVVIVGAIDGTVFDDVTCRIQSCVVGLGIGSGGEGNCADSTPGSTHADGAGFGASSPFTQGANYITQNISWLKLRAPDMTAIDAGVRQGDPEEGLGRVYTHLLCQIPERDDVSPTAPGLAGQMRDEMGTSYIQSYYVDQSKMEME